jgi:hypothetical protein
MTSSQVRSFSKWQCVTTECVHEQNARCGENSQLVLLYTRLHVVHANPEDKRACLRVVQCSFACDPV